MVAFQKDLGQWLKEYGESHQHPINKLIHWICVPLILFSIVGLLWCIPHNYFSTFVPTSIGEFINWATIVMIFILILYLRLSLAMFLGMLVIFCLTSIASYYLYSSPRFTLWKLSLGIFIVSWIGQFIGHKIEGKKPSSFQELQFLLIGPAWLLSLVYKHLSIAY